LGVIGKGGKRRGVYSQKGERACISDCSRGERVFSKERSKNNKREVQYDSLLVEKKRGTEGKRRIRHEIRPKG